MSRYTILKERRVRHMQELGQRVKKLRESRGWSQGELAKRAGVTRSAISTYEQGLRTPSADVLCALAKTFGVPADRLLGLAEGRMVDLAGLSQRDEALVRELVESLRQKDG